MQPIDCVRRNPGVVRHGNQFGRMAFQVPDEFCPQALNVGIFDIMKKQETIKKKPITASNIPTNANKNP
jgi:hypothetical protein